MNQHLKGAIYIRDNAWYKKENVLKLGISSCVKDRSNTYITGEVERGEYIYMVEIPLDKMKIIDNCLKNYFKAYNIYKGGGTEFYDRCIIDRIEPYLSKTNIEYKVLTIAEINEITRCERVKTLIERLKYKRKHGLVSIKPNDHQRYVLEHIISFFNVHNIGKLIWACGLGKALLSILIVNILKCNKTVLIGVPSNTLQKQMKNEILKLFPNKTNILFVGGCETDGIYSTTDKTKILEFLTNNAQPKFVISTYHSCHLLVDTGITFEFKIGDEAHHLVGVKTDDETRCFRLFHKISSSKTLFMTATEKVIEKPQTNKEIFSMDDETIFGKYIDIKSVQWAIDNKKITDYSIMVLKNTEEEVCEIINSLRLDITNKELFISCYMCLKSFEKYADLTHILLYTNTTDDADLCKKYINEILSSHISSFSIEDVYNNSLHSKNCDNLDSELHKFTNATHGIISCIYILSEGFDLPRLNGACIAGNMQSAIRIVQSFLRPNRLDLNNPNKKAYIIIPYIDSDDWETEKKSYEKIRSIVSQMRNVDKNIEQKISVSVSKKQTVKKTINCEKTYGYYIIGENIYHLNKLIFRLRHSKTLGSNCSEEQDEYNYVRSINVCLNIQSKEEYTRMQPKHNNFINNPDIYFKLKGVWTSWYDFIGVDVSKFIQSKEKWIDFCKEKGITSPHEYDMLCEKYDNLPKEPADFYDEFANIINELGINYNRRI